MRQIFPCVTIVWLISALPLSVFAQSQAEKIYQANCKACHSSEFVQAPKLGKKEDWKPRLEKGKKELVQSVIKGMQGYTGAMPPRGGNPKLSDQEIEAAVQYIMDAVK